MWALMTCVVAACSPSPRGEVESRGDVTPTPENITAGWPGASRDAATALIAKYGAPDESTPTLLIWHNKGPWKRTVLYKEEVPHSFPKPHVDVLEQFIDYRVPVDKFDDLAAYDGSVIVERTKGEISARCDKEPMNFLALNLTHDVVTGKLTVDAARAEYSRQAMAFMSQQPAPYTEGLKFNVARGGTADPDVPRPPQ
jgi:hypothetical protein